MKAFNTLIKLAEDISLYALEQAVCAYFNVTPLELKSASRAWRIVQARHVFVYLALYPRQTHYTLQKVGNYLGHRHHTTMVHSRRFIESQLDIKEQNILKALRDIGVRIGAGFF